ncbi:putative DNA helicase [Helianthus debilis subsp. tardiflorus]
MAVVAIAERMVELGRKQTRLSGSMLPYVHIHLHTSSNFCFISTANTAYYIRPHTASDEHPVQFLAMPEDALQMILSQVIDQNLRRTLQFGIALHHAG